MFRSDTAANSGKARDGIVNPKLGAVFGPWLDTELYLNYGGGFHSNDARGVTATVDPVSPLFNVSRSPFLVPSTGYEVGIRNRSIAGRKPHWPCSGWISPPRTCSRATPAPRSRAGQPPTPRFGIEWSNHYAVTPWLALEGDLTVTNARFSDRDPVGQRVPEAPTTIASAGITFGEGLGWFGSLRFRTSVRAR